jgi:predicted permease
VLLGALALLVLAGIGVRAQRGRLGTRARSALWALSFWGLAPALVLAAFLTVDLDRTLLAALAAAGLANWLVLAAAYGYATAVARSRDERGCLALVGAFGNTGYLGIPLALLALGRDDVADAVVYDRLGWILPVTALTTAVARTHGLRGDAREPGTRLRALAVNPPLIALGAALVLRAAGVDASWADELRDVASTLIGPVGFLLLGLSVPLGRAALSAREVGLGVGAVSIRMLGGPLALLGVSRLLGVDLPAAYFLLAGVPGAFHLLVLARVYDVRPVLMRALVVGSSAVAVVAIAVGAAVAG